MGPDRGGVDTMGQAMVHRRAVETWQLLSRHLSNSMPLLKHRKVKTGRDYVSVAKSLRNSTFVLPLMKSDPDW